jgi:hypothetical protein
MTGTAWRTLLKGSWALALRGMVALKKVDTEKFNQERLALSNYHATGPGEGPGASTESAQGEGEEDGEGDGKGDDKGGGEEVDEEDGEKKAKLEVVDLTHCKRSGLKESKPNEQPVSVKIEPGCSGGSKRAVQQQHAAERAQAARGRSGTGSSGAANYK